MKDAPTIVGLWLDGDAVSVDVREGWALTRDEADALYGAARAAGLGACLVSTCFRLELFVSGRRPAGDLLAWGRRQLAALRTSEDASVFRGAVDAVAVEHLFRVAAGLESAVLGEAQILGQVRRSRAAAERAGALSPALRLAFDAAVRAGQRVRSTTALARGSASTASAAVRWASDALGGLAGRHVTVAGGGQMGRLLVEHLASVRAASLTLISAYAPAHAGFHVIRPEAIADHLPQTEVLFAATDRTVLDRSTALACWADGAPRAVVDLGMPRNVDAEVQRVPGVALADIDALGDVVDAGLAVRRSAIPAAEALLSDALAELAEALETLSREQLVAEFRRRSEAIRQETLAYACGRCNDRTCALPEADSHSLPGPGPCSDPDGLTRTLTTRLLHDVTAALRETHDVDDDLLRRLLSLSDADA